MEGLNQKNIVINNMPVILRPVDRTPKTIGDWIVGLRVAENIYCANRTKLYDIYSMVILDGHLSGIIEKRINSILNREIYFDKSGEQDEKFDDLCESPEFRDLCKLILQQQFWGLSGIEFVPGADFKFNEIPRKLIRPETYTIANSQSSQTGITYNETWNLWVIGDWDDLGILLNCSPYVLWKKGVMGDWAQFIEVFGQPIMVMKYEASDETTREQLYKVINDAGNSLRMVIPTQAGFELAQSNYTANGDLHDSFRKACNEEMSVIILGATETTVSSKSSGYAQSNEHAKQQDEIIKSDCKFLLNHLNCPHFLSILKSYGYPVEGGKFRFENQVDLDTVSKQLAIDERINKLAPLGPDYFYDTYNKPKPKNLPAPEDTLTEDIPEESPKTPKAAIKSLLNFFGFAR